MNKQESQALLRLQISMWLGKHCKCLECKHQYESVDDFIKRNPYNGHTKGLSFVCKSCYPKYKKKHPLTKQSRGNSHE